MTFEDAPRLFVLKLVVFAVILLAVYSLFIRCLVISELPCALARLPLIYCLYGWSIAHRALLVRAAWYWYRDAVHICEDTEVGKQVPAQAQVSLVTP